MHYYWQTRGIYSFPAFARVKNAFLCIARDWRVPVPYKLSILKPTMHLADTVSV